MKLLDFIKSKHAKNFSKEANKRIEHYEFSCFIDKPIYYIYSRDMMDAELKKYDLYVSQVTCSNNLTITFVVTRL